MGDHSPYADNAIEFFSPSWADLPRELRPAEPYNRSRSGLALPQRVVRMGGRLPVPSGVEGAPAAVLFFDEIDALRGDSLSAVLPVLTTSGYQTVRGHTRVTYSWVTTNQMAEVVSFTS